MAEKTIVGGREKGPPPQQTLGFMYDVGAQPDVPTTNVGLNARVTSGLHKDPAYWIGVVDDSSARAPLRMCFIA